MGDYGQPAHQPLHWNAHQSLTLGHEAPARNYRKVLSRVAKPSSAGNSPHSHVRPRTMTAYHVPRGMPINTDVYSIQNSSIQGAIPIQPQKQPRPTSWHPSLRQSPYYVPNCHPSWLRDISVPAVEPQPGMTSMYGLSTPITCPISGDLLSTNDYFASQNESYNYLPPGPQTYTPVEPPDDMLFSEPSEWSTFSSMDGTPLSAYPWMQHPVPSTDAAVDFCHESVASADDLPAPPTPDQNPQDCRHSGVNGDDLVALGLYDEPQQLSFGSALLGGGDDFAYHRTGKGLKLEETFTPASEADDEDDADADADADDEDGEE